MKPSDPTPGESAGDFLSRWSQRKQQARTQAQAGVPKPAEDAGADKTKAAAETVPLPPVEQLDMNSDFRGFFQPKVDETLRRAALKKLFSDPHFNVMDGLDIYIDDYSISDPLPAAMLAELKQAQNILGWAKEDRENERLAAERQQLVQPAASSQLAAGESGPVVAPDSADSLSKQADGITADAMRQPSAGDDVHNA